MSSSIRQSVRQLYESLLNAYGPQGWWPGDSPTEIVVGAILTQNTNWRNVEKAISQLRQARVLNWKSLRDLPARQLAALIRPAGYYNVKARRLKNFVGWLWREHGGDLKNLRTVPADKLRSELLSINGVGPETADSILLYALDRPSFVVDAYTRRIAVRHGLAKVGVGYSGLQRIFEARLPREAALYNEYHALIVAVGKKHCGKKAKCCECPLARFPHNSDN